MVGNDKDVEDVILGKDGALEGMKKGAVLVDHTTASADVARKVHAAAEAKGITVRSSLDPSAGPVLGDADRLQQLVWNLLTNAIKFTPPGGRVDVQLVGSGAEAEVRVSDTGAGISRDFLPHVFEPFRQADASSGRKAGGLGLGLAIVRHVAELHGGRMEARSPGEGQGSTFILTLPAATGREEQWEVAPSASVLEIPATEAPVSLGGVHVLIVEDEADTREALSLIIAQAGAAVTAVGTAAEALAVLAASRPDILLCDIGLPTEDGYVLIRKLRALRAEDGGATPAVALSAFAQASDRARAVAAGFDTHLAKPTGPDRLLRTLADALSLKTGEGAPRGAPSPPVLASGTGPSQAGSTAPPDPSTSSRRRP